MLFDNPLNGIQLANFNPLDRGPLADFLNLFRAAGHPAPGSLLWHRGYAPGTVVDLDEGAPPLLCPSGRRRAIQYGVGVGREGFTWSGTKTVTM